MKKFNNFIECTTFINNATKEGIKKSIGIVAEQIYKDSAEFTYRDTGAMYQSGEANMDLENGVIVERSPYVRRRYYEGGNPGAKSPKEASARWYDKTWARYNEDYKKMSARAIIKHIKEQT